MKVTHESEGGAAVFIVEGQVDLHTSPELRSHLRTALVNKSTPLVVDLKMVSFIDSSGLATLIEALKSVGSYGGKLRLCGLNADVRRLFELARLNEVFDLRDSRADATAAG
jgi:anti-sigma B factor antagonist